MKAFKRAQEQAKEEGIPLEDIAAKRWGSLEKFNQMLANAKEKASSTDRQPERRDQMSNTVIDRNRDIRRSKSRDRKRSRSTSREARRNRSRSKERRRDRSYDRDRRRDRSRSKERRRDRSKS